MFPRAGQVAYLDTAAEGLPPASAGEALQTYFEHKSLGSQGRERLYATELETAALAAGLLGAPAKDVALLANASDGLNLLAHSIDWAPGDEVVMMDLEFPSNVLPWLDLRGKGVRTRLVRSHEGAVSLEDFLGAIGARTRLVTVSQVSFKNGFQVPFIGELAAATRAVGAIFCVDARLALGRVAV